MKIIIVFILLSIMVDCISKIIYNVTILDITDNTLNTPVIRKDTNASTHNFTLSFDIPQSQLWSILISNWISVGLLGFAFIGTCIYMYRSWSAQAIGGEWGLIIILLVIISLLPDITKMNMKSLNEIISGDYIENKQLTADVLKNGLVITPKPHQSNQIIYANLAIHSLSIIAITGLLIIIYNKNVTLSVE